MKKLLLMLSFVALTATAQTNVPFCEIGDNESNNWREYLQYAVPCTKDECCVCGMNISITFEKSKPATGQWVSDVVADWCNLYIGNLEGYVTDDKPIGKVDVVTYKAGMTASALEAAYGNSFKNLLTVAMKSRPCEKAPYGPYAESIKIEPIWKDANRVTYSIKTAFDYSGSNGYTRGTRLVTLNNKGKELRTLAALGVNMPDFKQKVFRKLKALKAEYGMDLDPKTTANKFFTEMKINPEDYVALVGKQLIVTFPAYSVGIGAEGEYVVKLPLR